MDPLLLRGLLAAVLGGVAMTLSSTTEMYLRERPPSETPGEAGNKLLGLLGLPRQTGQRLTLLSTWVHWIYSTIWGAVFWLLMDPDLGGLGLIAAGQAFFALVWGMALLGLPALGLAPPLLAVGPKGSGDRRLAPCRLCRRDGGRLVAHLGRRLEPNSASTWLSRVSEVQAADGLGDDLGRRAPRIEDDGVDRVLEGLEIPASRPGQP